MDDLGWLPVLSLRSAPMLRGIRTVFVAFVAAIMLCGYSASIIAMDWKPRGSAAPWAVAIVMTGTASLAVGLLLRRRELDGGSPAALRRSFSQNFFVRLAAPESVAILGLSAALLAGRPWLYWLSTPVVLVGLALAAPTTRELGRRQHEVARRGNLLVVVHVLSQPPLAP